jgi:hypothetical protein
LKVRYSGIELVHEYYQDKFLFFEGVNKLPKHSASGVTFAHRENWISCLSSHQLFKDSAAEATQTSQLAVLAVLPQVVVMAISLDPSGYNTVPHFRRKATQARLISNDQFGQNIHSEM